MYQDIKDSVEDTGIDVPSGDLELLNNLTKIKLRLRRDITTDFVLAKLGNKDREFAIEMTINAYLAKRIIEMYKNKGKIYEEGVPRELNDEERKIVQKRADAMFDMFMNKVFMVVILNRNIDGNYLINVLSGYKSEKKEGEESIESLQEALTELTKNEGEKK